MRIVIIDAYCYMNKGDSGIINVMVRDFKKKYPLSNISVVSLYPDIDQGKYGECDVIGPIFKEYSGRNKYFRVIRNISLYYFYILTNCLGLSFNHTIKEIKKADFVISCGGGFFQIKSIKDFVYGFQVHMIQMRTAIQFKKNLVFYAQTIGKFTNNRYVMSEVKKVLNSAKLILARESITYHYLEKILGKSKDNYFLTGDAAFLLDKKPVYNILSDEKKYLVGITVRDWNFPGYYNSRQLRNKYISSIVELVNNLAARNDTAVYFLPQVIGPGGKSDLIISKEIFDQVENTDNVRIVDNDLTPQELKYLYSHLNLLVGTRMHSNIFALSEKIPCVAISYDPKTDGIMSDLDLSRFVINIAKISPQLLIEKVSNALLCLSEIKEHLNIKIPNMKKKSMENNRLLYKLIDNING